MSDSKTPASPVLAFQMFAVVNKTTGKKAAVHYSLDNRGDGKKAITIYDRDYGRDLQQVFEGVEVSYINDTDSMTDYFDKGRIVIFETDAIYADARKQVEATLAKIEAFRANNRAKRDQRRAARRVARFGQVAA